MAKTAATAKEKQRKLAAHLARARLIRIEPPAPESLVARKKAARDAEAAFWARTNIGEEMIDGTFYVGFSPETGEHMYAMPKDAPLKMSFNAAAEYAAGLDACGHRDWRVPSKEELHVLFENMNKGDLKKAFNLEGSYPNGYYWSSTPGNDPVIATGWSQRLDTGGQYNNDSITNRLSIHCIRSGPRPQ